MRRRHAGASFFYDFQELARVFDNDLRLTGFEGLGLYQFAADTQRRGACLDEFSSSVQVDSARRHERNLRSWTFQRLDVLCSSSVAAGKYLDEVRPTLPSLDHLHRRQ